MSSPFNPQRRSALALALVLAGASAAGCGDEGGTYALLELSASPPLTGLATIELSVDFGGDNKQTTLTTTSLPTTASIAITDGREGPITVTATARDGAGVELARKVSTASITSGKTVRIPIAFGTQAGDGGIEGLAIDRGSHDFGTLPQAGQSGVASFTVTNGGSLATSALATALDPATTHFTVVSDQCVGQILAPGSTCRVGVRFNPLVQGLLQTTLRVTATQGGAAAAVLSGTGVAQGALEITPAALDLGSVVVGGQSAIATFTVKNTGTEVTGALAAELTGSDMQHFAVATNGCAGQTLQSGASCTVLVRFAPVAAGPRSATLVARASPGGTAVALLEATGVGAGRLSIGPANHDFMGVAAGGQGAPVRFTVTNAAAVTGTLTSVLSGTGALDYEVVADGCQGTTLSSAGTCDVQVRFKPRAGGVAVASLVVSDGASATAAASLMGLGLEPLLNVMPAAHDFGNVATAATAPSVSFTVRNDGGAASAALALSLAGTDAAEFRLVTNTCVGVTLAPAATCTVSVDFTPTTTGSKSARLDVVAGSQNLRVNLVGAGRTPRALTLTATGPGAVTTADGQVNCPGDCSGTFADGAMVTLTAAPQATYTAVWSGACAGTTGNSCTVTMNGDQTAGVVFDRGIDLVVTNVLCTPTVTVGSQVSCSLTIQNRGPDPAGVILNRISLSTDVNLGGDAVLGICPVPALAGGAQATVTCMGNVPIGALSGSWQILAEVDSLGVVTEVDENNNHASTPIDVQTITTDLQISALNCAIPGPLAPDATVNCTVTVANLGSAPASAVMTQLYHSADLTLNESDSAIGTCPTIATLAPGASVELSCTGMLLGGGSPGLQLVGAGVDPGDSVVEANEANNFASQRVGVGAVTGIDLIVESMTCPATWPIGGTAECTARVSNIGTVAAGAFVVDVMLSLDPTISPSDLQVARCSVAGLAALTATNVTCVATVPSTLPGLFFFVGVGVDPTAQVTETSEANNTQAQQPYIILTGTGIDIVVLSVVCADVVERNGFGSCRTTFKNLGDAPAPAFTYTLRQSNDLFITGSDPLVATCDVAALAPGASAQVTCAGTLSATGTFLGVITNTISGEARTLNNTGSDAFVIAVPGIDVQAQSLVCTPQKIAPSASTTCMMVLRNLGSQMVGPQTIELRRSTDSTIDGSDVLLVSCPFLGGVAPGTDRRQSCFVNNVAATPRGYYLGMLTAVVGDVNATNNVATTSVSVGPDLELMSLLCTPNPAEPSGSFSCSATIFNSGSSSNATTIELWLSDDGTIDGGDTLLKSCNVSPLAALGMATLTCAGTLPNVAPAQRFIIGLVDPAGSVTEWNKLNNSRLFSIRMGPDLYALSVACSPDSVMAGQNVSCNVTVYNSGSQVTLATSLDLVLSNDSVMDLGAGDLLITTCTIPAVGAESEVVQTCAGTVPAGLGTGLKRVGGIADATGLVPEFIETNNNIGGTDSLTVM